MREERFVLMYLNISWRAVEYNAPSSAVRISGRRSAVRQFRVPYDRVADLQLKRLGVAYSRRSANHLSIVKV